MNERNLPHSSNKKRILITGVSGLIGRILFNYLTNQYEVFGLDQHMNISSRYGDKSQDFQQIIEQKYPLSKDKFFQCDITHREKLHQFISENQIEIIIHLAAVLETHPDLDYIHHVNIQGTKNIFEAPGVERILFGSSVRTIFGYLRQEPYQSIYTTTLDILPKITADDYPPLSINETPGDEMYCRTKIVGEQMAEEIVKKTSKSIICIRFGWVTISDHGGDTWLKSVWLSYRDLCSFIDRSLQSPNSIHGIYFALSNNSPSWIDLDKPKKDFGYVPQDSSSS